MNRHAPLLLGAVSAALLFAYAVAILMGVFSPAVHAEGQTFPLPSPTQSPTP